MNGKNDSFLFHCPTKIYYRPEGLSTIGEILRQDYSYRKAYVVVGFSSFERNGFLSLVERSLADNGISYRLYSGIQSNPDVRDVRAMVEECRKDLPDVVLACGGGSVIDACKLLRHAVYYDGNCMDFVRSVVKPLHSLPLGTVLTLAASGSEMSDSAVISDRQHRFKGGFNVVANYPTFSLLDPTLLKSVPSYHVACGLADMFSHSFERYFSPSHPLEPCDEIALSVMRSIVKTSYEIINENGDKEEGRRAMMILGSLSHDGFTSYGKRKAFLVHQVEHKLSGRYPELIHGQGIALLLPIYLEQNKDLLQGKIFRMAEQVFETPTSSIGEAIQALRSWLDFLPLAHRVEDLAFPLAEEDWERAKEQLRIRPSPSSVV